MSEIEDLMLNPSKTYVKLPRLLAFKVELPRTNGEGRTIGAFCRSNCDEGLEEFEICCDGDLVAFGTINVGHDAAIKMVKSMVHGLVTVKQHRIRNRLNRKARKTGAEAIDRQLRPILPKDDE